MNKKLGVVFGAAIAIFVSVLFFTFTISEPIVQETIVKEKRKATLVTGDGDPGDNSGLFYFQIRPHVEDMAGTYDTNQSNATAYEYCDYGNMSCTGETPYSPTTFDIVWKVGVTNEDGYWTDNQSRNPGYNWLIGTCTTPLGFTDLNVTNEFFIGNSTEYAWYHYVIQDADGGNGTGFTITEGQSFNVTGKFYVNRIV